MIWGEGRGDVDVREARGSTDVRAAAWDSAIALSIVRGVLLQLEAEASSDADELRSELRRDLEALDKKESWVPLGICIDLSERYGAHLGLHALRAAGRRTLQAERRVGLLAPILRSWIRAFNVRPELLLRVGPHLWRAAVRNGGRVELRDQTRASVAFRVHDVPRALRDSIAIRTIIEGIGEGLFDVAGIDGRCFTTCPAEASSALDFVATWRSAESA